MAGSNAVRMTCMVTALFWAVGADRLPPSAKRQQAWKRWMASLPVQPSARVKPSLGNVTLLELLRCEKVSTPKAIRRLVESDPESMCPCIEEHGVVWYRSNTESRFVPNSDRVQQILSDDLNIADTAKLCWDCNCVARTDGTLDVAVKVWPGDNNNYFHKAQTLVQERLLVLEEACPKVSTPDTIKETFTENREGICRGCHKGGAVTAGWLEPKMMAKKLSMNSSSDNLCYQCTCTHGGVDSKGSAILGHWYAKLWAWSENAEGTKLFSFPDRRQGSNAERIFSAHYDDYDKSFYDIRFRNFW